MIKEETLKARCAERKDTVQLSMGEGGRGVQFVTVEKAWDGFGISSLVEKAFP